jgi:hypothetical protein
MTTLLAAPISVSVETAPEAVVVEVTDTRNDTIALLTSLNQSQREALSVDAWRIGLRALASAHSQAQESRLEDVGQSLVRGFEQQLKLHVESQQQTLSSLLAKYFDPSDGQVSVRLADFVSNEGALAKFLSGFLAPQNSVLAEALAKQLGESSPLLKKLSPTDSEGVVKQVERQIQSVLENSRSELALALDPLAPNGAVAKFLRQLREELKAADEGFSQQLDVALAALNANDENSLLSRLIRETDRARESLMRAVNPDVADSPLAVLKASIEKLLQEHARSNEQLLRDQREHQVALERAVNEALARLDARRSVTQVSPQGGFDFEDAAIAVIADVMRGAPCVVERTGNSVGTIPRSKVGDCVVRFTSDSAFSGSATVFEMKHAASYSVADALKEIEEARRNRNASTGVFVMAKSHAPADFPSFGRYGNDVLVTWDDTDPASLPFFQAAILLGVGLVSRHRAVASDADLAALRDAESRLLSEVERLDKMEKGVEAIRRQADLISGEIRKGQNALNLIVRNAQSTLAALNNEIVDEAAERASPILAAKPAALRPIGSGSQPMALAG